MRGMSRSLYREVVVLVAVADHAIVHFVLAKSFLMREISRLLYREGVVLVAVGDHAIARTLYLPRVSS